FMPGKGLLAGSPSDKAKTLNETATWVNQRLTDPNNVPGDADKPPPNAKEGLKVFDTKQLAVASIDGFASPESGSDLGRRQPKVLPIAEAAVGVGRVQVQSYIFENGMFVGLKEPVERNNPDARMVRLRNLLKRRGIDPNTVLRPGGGGMAGPG